ncbi:hypothetical protein [Williamsia sp. DF01-3]|nr:hypothetical protein [Williamsia sp. DF01-3]MCK0516670.1 hypothetical protein [Williamsia sp. DF01-3]
MVDVTDPAAVAADGWSPPDPTAVVVEAASSVPTAQAGGSSAGDPLGPPF